MNASARQLRTSAGSRGYSLAECAIATVIVGLTLVAAVRAVGAARSGELRRTNVNQSATLAQELLEEIGGQPYWDSSDNATVDGPTAAERMPGNRSLFNDVNDYRGWTESPPVSKYGSSLGFDTTWRRSVDVVYVNPANPATTLPGDAGMVKVTVRVLRNNVPMASVSMLRSAGLPASQSCAIPGKSCVNLAPSLCIALGGTPGGDGSNCWTSAENSSSSTGSGLVARWTMDESSGTTAADLAGGFDATVVNGATFGSGQLSNALVLDGIDDTASVANASPLSQTSTMTIAAWVYLDSLPAAGTRYCIIHKGKTTTARNYFLSIDRGPLQLDSSVSFGFRDATGIVSRFTAGSISKTKRWRHVAATFDDNANQVVIYLDGVAILTQVAILTPAANSESLTIGSSPDGEYFKGRLDDVRIYKRVLSASDVSTLYGGGEP